MLFEDIGIRAQVWKPDAMARERKYAGLPDVVCLLDVGMMIRLPWTPTSFLRIPLTICE